MEKDTFRKQINRLIETYGKELYPDSRLEVFWRELCAASDDSFVRTVDKLIGNSRFPPMLDDIRGAMRSFRQYDFTRED